VLTDAGSKEKNEEGEESEASLALDSIGCTANVVMVDNVRKKLFVANAGDSRAVMG